MDIRKNLKYMFMAVLPLIFFCCRTTEEQAAPVNSHQLQVNELYASYDQVFTSRLQTATANIGKAVIRLSDFSDRFTVPKKLDIRGSHYDIGRFIGEMAVQYGQRLPELNDTSDPFNRQIIDMYQRIHPPYLELIRGVADAYGRPWEVVDLKQMEYQFFVGLWTGMLQYNSFFSLTSFSQYGNSVGPDDDDRGRNCSVASYYDGDRHLVGRNFDNPSDRPHYFTDAQATGYYRTLGHSIYALYHWFVDGINEKGLSINVATNLGDFNWQEAYPDEPAIFAGHIARIAMDTCATVDEVIAVFRSTRIWFPNEGVHWIVADASGRSVVLEYSLDRELVVIDRNGPYELMTNTTLQHGDDYTLNNCYRFRFAKPILDQGIAGFDDLYGVMDGMRPGRTSSAGTLWMSLMDLKNRTFRVYYRKEFSRMYTFNFN